MNELVARMQGGPSNQRMTESVRAEDPGEETYCAGEYRTARQREGMCLSCHTLWMEFMYQKIITVQIELSLSPGPDHDHLVIATIEVTVSRDNIL